MRYELRTRRTEVWVYVVETDRELTEGDVATMGGDEWEELTGDAECDCRSEEEDYVPGTLRKLG